MKRLSRAIVIAAILAWLCGFSPLSVHLSADFWHIQTLFHSICSMEPGEDSQQSAAGHESEFPTQMSCLLPLACPCLPAKTLDVNKLLSLKKKAIAKQAGSEERPEVSITSAAPTAATSSPARSAYESTVPYPPKPSKHRVYDHKSRHVVTQGVEAGASAEGAAGASEVSGGVAGTSGGAAGVEAREDSPRRRKGNRWVTVSHMPCASP